MMLGVRGGWNLSAPWRCAGLFIGARIGRKQGKGPARRRSVGPGRSQVTHLCYSKSEILCLVILSANTTIYV